MADDVEGGPGPGGRAYSAAVNRGRFASSKSLEEALGVVMLDNWVRRGWLVRVLTFHRAVGWSRDTGGYVGVPELLFRCVPGTKV